MSIFHDLAYGLAAVVSSPVWGYKLARTGKWRTDWAGRFGKTLLTPDDRPTLLIHAVSVGEVNATRQLVKRFAGEYGDQIRMVIASTTNTGIARAKQLYEPDHEVVRFPFDFSFAVGRLLDAIRPDVVALMELEVWPNFIACCKRRQVPVTVINGRLSERSYRGYRRVRPLVKPMFANLTVAAVQDPSYAERFVGLGTPEDRVHVTGTMKWDATQITDHVAGADALAQAMGIDRNLPLIVCGSTGPGEEQLFADHLGKLTDEQGRPVQLLITPRKPERFNEAAAALGDPIRRTRHVDGTIRQPDGNRIFLLDTMGELAKAYSLADAVVVGRSFNGQWGSDMMEPIALGKPVGIGPNTSDFADTMTKLLEGDGIIQLPSADRLAPTVLELLNTERGKRLAERGRTVIRQQQGATERNYELLNELLKARIT